MKKLLFAAVLAATAATGARAQTFPATWGNRMQAVLDSVNTVNHNLVGITAAVNVPGYGLWKGAAGISSPGEPMTTDMRVLIGSNSKLFLAATMLKLQEAGVLSLDDHIGKWIHSGPTTVDTTATIRQLLLHESGMADYANDNPASYSALTLYGDTSAIYSAQTDLDSAGAPLYPKGRGWHYSNSGYAVCSLIIEAATGQPYWQNLRTQVLTPLGMDSTYIPVFEPYQPIAGTNYYGSLFTGYYCTSFATASPGNGDVASTPQQMVEWYQKLFSGQVLTPASMQELLTFEPALGTSFSLEEIISPRLGPEYYFSGFVGAFTSEAMYDKDTKASVFIALNTYNDSVTTTQYLEPLLDVLVQERPKQANDAGITSLQSPTGTICAQAVNPVVTLKNFGNATLTSVKIEREIDGVLPADTYNWSGSLAPGASVDVTLNTLSLTNGKHDLDFYIALPNGVPEIPNGTTAWNDHYRTWLMANLATPYNGYFSEDFEDSTTPLFVWSTNNGQELQAGVSALSGYNSIHSLVRNCVNNPDFGNVSNIDLPAVTIVPGSSPVFSFRYAYRNWTGVEDDSLQALISTDCGATWTSLFYKGGDDLSGGNSTTDLYFPQTAAEWTTESIPLSAYSGDVLIRFRQHNSEIQGQDVWIDDITVGAPSGISSIPGTQMQVYPNPARAQVTIGGLPANTAIRLTDITGKLLEETVSTGSNTIINISKLMPGVYLLGSPYGTTKLVKE